MKNERHGFNYISNKKMKEKISNHCITLFMPSLIFNTSQLQRNFNKLWFVECILLFWFQIRKHFILMRVIPKLQSPLIIVFFYFHS